MARPWVQALVGGLIGSLVAGLVWSARGLSFVGGVVVGLAVTACCVAYYAVFDGTQDSVPPAALYLEGFCPAGCGRTLHVGAEHRVRCLAPECPDPGLVDEMLAAAGEAEHIVDVSNFGWSITHPLREHGQDLQACALHRHLRAIAGDSLPVSPGRYRVVRQDGSWSWEALHG